MIRFPTVLVIGAGASIPYGFPSGKSLRDTICSPIFINSIKCPYEKAKAEDFVRAFRDSHINSIDAFLSRRTEHVEIGKLAIAKIISKAENPDVFRNSIADDWYSLLWNKIVSGIHSIDDLHKNNIKIVTFNYDRSLEYFLHMSMMNTFKVSYKAALEALKCIPIIHFYGQLGELSNSYLDSELPYKNAHEDDSLHKASLGIKIIPEVRDGEVPIKLISEWVVNSRNIFFLGFGFDSLNIARLGLKETLESRYGKDAFPLQIMASTLGLTTSEANLARTAITGSLIDVWNIHHGTNTETLRHFAERFT
jgi:hypothetical protein